jgi:hypothetical protein
MTQQNVKPDAMQDANVAEAGWITSTLLFPFKVLFVGVTYLLQLVGVIAMAVGPAVAGLGAFIWYLSGKARHKFSNFQEAKRADPRKAEEAKKYADKVADKIHDPKVQSVLRTNEKAADVLHDSLDDLGQGQAVAASIVAVATVDLQSSRLVTAATSTAASLRREVTKRLMAVVPRSKAGLTAFIWFASGLEAHDWISVVEAEQKSKARVNAAKAYAKLVRVQLAKPANSAMFADNSRALTFVQNALNQLG